LANPILQSAVELGLNLMISHLVNGFDANNSSTESLTLRMFLDLDLCLTRTHCQNGFGIRMCAIVEREMRSAKSRLLL